MTHRMDQWLRNLGCRKDHYNETYILDEFDSMFYILFDASECPETPSSVGTVDILVSSVTDPMKETIRLVADANEAKVSRFLFSLGVSRLPDKTRDVLHQMANPLRGITAQDR